MPHKILKQNGVSFIVPAMMGVLYLKSWRLFIKNSGEGGVVAFVLLNKLGSIKSRGAS